MDSNEKGSEWGMTAILRIVRLRYPQVRQLSTAELASWLADCDRVQPVLLDVRSEEEYAVSHLPGARRVDPKAPAAEVLASLPAGRPVVAYCAVGYRSSGMAQALMRAGLSDVYSLEGSIFVWANAGRPLESQGQPTDKVHPYDRISAKLLAPQYRGRL